MNAVDNCPEGVDVRKLPVECRETAKTPKELFGKLKQWGFETLVIPHGTTWGFYTPPGYLWDKQLAPEQDDAQMQKLIEVMSGHGNSEEYRAWLATSYDAQGKATCPATRKNFTPCCQRAAEIIRSRCGTTPKDQCDKRAADARQRYVDAGTFGHLTVPGAPIEDWKDCGQCTDCFVPSFMYRPGGSVQYILARGYFKGAKPRHVVMGFMASSDNHSSRPGTGYKEFARRSITEATGAKSKEWRERIFGLEGEATPESIPIGPAQLAKLPPFKVVHAERQASFFLTGGLIAVHSQGRKRGAIWDAMNRREVYGTSGDRILLWFDLLKPDGKKAPMGSELKLGTAPRFSVRAAGAFKQKPGCPDWSVAGVSTERLKRLCKNECYNPSDERRRITRIEVIRIRPQQRDDEPLEPLIEDVWKKHDCSAKGSSCEMQFEDPTFVEGKRDVIYYVRAIQEPTPAVNAASVRCERDKAGNCVRARPCYGDYRTPLEDDCLASNEERAWSSPVYVRFDAAAAKAAAEKAAKEAADKAAAEGEQDGGAAGPSKKDG